MKKCTKPKQTNCLAVLNQNGQTSPLPPGDIGWGLEIALDVQMAHAICQNCRINLYETNSNSFANLAAGGEHGRGHGSRDAHLEQLRRPSAATAARSPAYNHPKIGRHGLDRRQRVRHRLPGQPEHGRRGRRHHAAPERERQLRLRDRLERRRARAARRVITAQSWQTSATNWAAIGCGTKRGMDDVSAVADPATGAAVYDSYGRVRLATRSAERASLRRSSRACTRWPDNVATWNYPAQSVYRLAGQPARRHDGQQRVVRARTRCSATPASATTCRPASERRTGWAASKHPVRSRSTSEGGLRAPFRSSSPIRGTRSGPKAVWRRRPLGR